MNEKRILALILGLFILLGSVYALTTPVFEASDELWHYPMIRHLADGNPLPVQVTDPALAGPWKQEASQPPLYYYVGAALTFWIDSSDMEQIRWLNPHVDNGISPPDGNINLVVHDPANSAWKGTLLAVRIVRLVSVLMGATAVFLTYLIAKEIIPDRPALYLGATAAHAFTPMFLFISGAVNNDNLAIPLASLTVLLLIRTVTNTQPSPERLPHVEGKGGKGNNGGDHRYGFDKLSLRWLVIGAVIGLALLTKEGTFGLLPLAGGTIFINRWQQDRDCFVPRCLLALVGKSLLTFALMLIPVALIAGWWYARNITLYGDFLGWSAFIAVLGQRAQPATLAQLWDERQGFLMSYWGLFGGVNVPMALWIYTVLNGVMAISVVGFFIYFGQTVLAYKREMATSKSTETAVFNQFILTILHFIESRFGLTIILLFAFAVVYGLVQWATTTWSSQGRLVFTAISGLNILMVLGLAGWLPRRWGRWVVGGLSLFMFAIAAAAPLLWIAPAYRPSTYALAMEAPATPVSYNFNNHIALTGFAIAQERVQPGDTLDLTLEWEILDEMDANWSVFVHLIDPVLGVPIAQRDMYTGQGLRPTSLLATGERVENYYQVTIPKTAVSPATLDLAVGLYNFQTGERLDAPITLATLPLTAAAGTLPNPTDINFGDELALVGYSIAPRRTDAGEVMELVLYWEVKRPLSTNYTFFAQLVGDENKRWGSNDFAPPDGTASWAVGEVQEIHMPISIAADTPADVYPIHLGVYTQVDGAFQRLQLVSENGRITQDDFLLLTKVRIDD